MTSVFGDEVSRGAERIQRAFEAYQQAFLDITRRARGRFERRDWLGVLQDGRDRLALYGTAIGRVTAGMRASLGGRAAEVSVWAAIRETYAEAVAGHPAIEVAETFFNSVTRRVCGTVGVEPSIEFVDFEFERVPVLTDRPFRTYVRLDDTSAMVRRILDDHAFAVPYADADRDARRVAERIESRWAAARAPSAFEDVELLEAVFYRRKGAYLVGRVRGGNRVMPLVLALVHAGDAIAVDAVLLREEDVSVVFGFTRAYFHVDVRRPADVIEFLRSIMPVKPVWELYAALGYPKHGKTEFYRHLYRHLSRTDECFEVAAGTRGMVMAVFTMPSLDVVFKVIRDTFSYPKQTTPDDVKRRYGLVFAHDRAGRLVDAQVFEGLAFPTDRFARPLLRELLETASRTVRVDGDRVVLGHLYTERRVRPLDLYLRDADTERARRAYLDYGQAVRDLAATNVFPGDLLLKNFGVTRHGRVVFYDYDELCLLDECRFRDLPVASHPDDELADEPWFGVRGNDVFPEELIRFVPLSGAARDAFLEAHGSLFGSAFWRDLQERNAAGEVIDVFPYREERRLG